MDARWHERNAMPRKAAARVRRALSGRPPKILGTDFAGTVAALGPGTAGPEVGSAVLGTTAEAFAAQEGGGVVGKVVIRVDPPA
jgi:NADPH:quinone reductase-like Zn-dependent oxidoreductase